MKKFIFLLMCACFVISLNADEVLTKQGLFYKLTKDPTPQNYPIKKHHAKLGFTCATCHGEPNVKDKSLLAKVPTSKCMECHSDYKALGQRTAGLGYDDNVHSSPHYPDMDCNLCHATHTKSKNYCVMCHSQETMKNLLVP